MEGAGGLQMHLSLSSKKVFGSLEEGSGLQHPTPTPTSLRRLRRVIDVGVPEVLPVPLRCGFRE